LICPNNRKDEKMKMKTRSALKCEDALHAQVGCPHICIKIRYLIYWNYIYVYISSFFNYKSI
jgi:hypothetical protein